MFIRAVKCGQDFPGIRFSRKVLINTDHIIAVEELKNSGNAYVTCTGITQDEITTYVLAESYEHIVSKLIDEGVVI